MKVLIVDDNKALTFFLQAVIEGEKHSVKTANDGEDGYSAYLHFKPDVVITDIEMPKKNGFELMRNIREHDPRIMTIYMSGNIDGFCSLLEEEKERYQARFLGKPFSIIELINLLSKRRG